MRSLKKILLSVALVAASASLATAQRPRPVSNEPAAKTDASNAKTDASKTRTTTAPTPSQPAPQSVKAKYEGGFLGYSKKTEGTLNFDDLNQRLVFRDKTNKELVSIPYAAIVSAFPDTQSRRSTAASVISSLPYGFPAMFIKTKYRYLALQYSDPDTQTSGTTSFKLDTKELIASMLGAIGNKAGLTPRGDAYIRRKATDTGDTAAKPE
jgi:hypothetical protein